MNSKRNRTYWTIQLICWPTYILYVSVGIYYFMQDISQVILSIIANLSLFLFGTHIYRLYVYKKQIESLKWYKFVAYPVTANFIISIVVCVLNAKFFHFAEMFAPKNAPLIPYYMLQVLDTFRFAMPWFIFYHGIRYARNNIRNERAKVYAQMQLRVAELENLNSQLNPHFLFNSLNSIKSLSTINPTQAKEATTRLSDLLRRILEYRNLSEISLEQELTLVESYLTMEQIRFDQRLKYSFEIKPDTMTQKVLPMSLQLLAENAVKHGISQSKKGGTITIFSKMEDNKLILGVRNTGKFIENNGKNNREGIGLNNLKRRLLLRYNLPDCLEIKSLEGEVEAIITLPMA
jgi:two-component sensor histidine kinase